MRDFAHVGFVYSQACPLKCDFCCHTIENVGKGRFRPSSVIPIILDFSKYSSVRRFVFTGGEPFLFIGEIFEILQEIRGHGVRQPIHIVTSGNWAKSQSETDETISRLCQLGMDSIWISYDHEHARFVPVENIKFIANSCRNSRIPMKVQGVFWHQSERVEDLLKGREFDNVHMSSTPVASIGEARINWVKRGQDFELPDSDKHSCGAPKVYNIAIYPNGDAFPCCAGGFQKEAKLLTGNAFKNNAKEILEQTFGLFHARIAKEIGFDKLYSHVEKHSPELLRKLPSFSEATTVCEICRDIHSSSTLMEQLKPIYESMEIEYALSRVEALLEAQRKQECKSEAVAS
jgi:hypothetical protein